MTDALPGLTFDKESGELSRGDDLVMTLRGQRLRLFAALFAADGQFTKTTLLADIVNIDDCRVATVVQNLRARLKPFGVTVEAKQGFGYRIVVGDIPKWQPTIPPVTDDPNLLKMPR